MKHKFYKSGLLIASTVLLSASLSEITANAETSYDNSSQSQGTNVSDESIHGVTKIVSDTDVPYNAPITVKPAGGTYVKNQLFI